MAEYAEKPRWMAEPSLQDIPQEKLDFLQKMVFEGSAAISDGTRPAESVFEYYLLQGRDEHHHRGDQKIQHSGRAFKNEPDYEADAAREIALHLPR